MKIRAFLYSAICIMLIASPKYSNAGWELTQWTTGGFVQSLTVNGTILLAGTDQMGVFITKNYGDSWAPVNSGLTKKSILSLSAGGTDIFAGTTGGAFRTASTDVSWSWTAMNPTSMNKCIQSLAVNGTNLFAGTTNGLFLTTNNGTSWSSASTGMTDTMIFSLMANGKNLFAGTNNGVYLSTDNGVNWARANAGLNNMIVYSLAGIGKNIFAGTYYNGVFVSTDNGAIWRLASSGLRANYVNSLVTSDQKLFAGTYNGVYASVDYGQSWKAYNEGLTDTMVLSLAVNGPYLFAGTHDQGVWRMPLDEVSAVGPTPGGPRAGRALTINVTRNSAVDPVIDFTIGRSDRVFITLHDVSGRRIATLVNDRYEAGSHCLHVRGARLAKGCYTVKMRTAVSGAVARRFPLL